MNRKQEQKRKSRADRVRAKILKKREVIRRDRKLENEIELIKLKLEPVVEPIRNDYSA